MKRDEMKARVRKLVKEMQEPRTMAGFRQMAGEMEGMPTSFGSALSAGKPVGERIAGMSAELRKPVEALVISILDLIDQSVEEKGTMGAEAIAQGVTQGLKSRGFSLASTALPQQMGEAVVPKDEHNEKVKNHLADIKKSVPNMSKADEKRIEGELHTLMQQADKQFSGRKSVTESALRSEIRQALIEEGFFDDVRGAAAQAASKAFSSVAKRGLKMAVKDLTKLELPDSKADAMGELVKHAAPILINGNEEQFRIMMQKLGATQFGKAGEQAVEKMQAKAGGEVKKEGALRGRKRKAVNEISDWTRDSFNAVSQVARATGGATQAELDAVKSALPEMEKLVRELAMATENRQIMKAMVTLFKLWRLSRSLKKGKYRMIGESNVSDIARSSMDIVSQAALEAGATEEDLAAVEAVLPQIDTLIQGLANATYEGDVNKVGDILNQLDSLYNKITNKHHSR